ncbi:hypothetical protein BaRGS_00015374 [Batillaria attramentaria]|uniref:Uncharacterized protein n=1 Tax=Batillaria attramentaria TaxID=370345 RepID=A0ABD0L238_9CAEN
MQAFSKQDREIAERLEKLREKPQEQKVSEKEINERLARLKGEDPAVRTAPPKYTYQPPDRRTQIEQIDDLLDEIANEVEIDSHRPDPAKDVENRLAKLKKNASAGSNSSQTKGGTDVDPAEVHELMARAAQQMEQEAQQALEGMKKDKQLMERLAEIKQRQKNKAGEGTSGNTGEAGMHSCILNMRFNWGMLPDEQSLGSNVDNIAVDDNDSENEEEAAKRLMQRFMEEAKLDEQVGAALADGPEASAETTKKSGKSKSKQPKKNTEDAVIRCRDCDMDLYCDKCFKEGHKELGLNDHRTTPYKAPKGYR